MKGWVGLERCNQCGYGAVLCWGRHLVRLFCTSALCSQFGELHLVGSTRSTCILEVVGVCVCVMLHERT